MSVPFHSIGEGLRRMYYESDCGSVEEFLESLKPPDDPSGLDEFHPDTSHNPEVQP